MKTNSNLSPMGASSNGKEDMGMSRQGETFSDQDDMDIDDSAITESSSINDLGEEFLKSFCSKASMAFFNEYGLISYQINSYNNFIKKDLQKAFDSFEEPIIEPGYDPSKKGESEWQYASVYTMKRVQSDKFKTGKQQIYVQKNVLNEETADVIIGRIPVMVKSDLCWMSGAEKGDCDFDHGAYFLIKGAEKVFIAQEQVCMKRPWISNNLGWTVAYKSEMRGTD